MSLPYTASTNSVLDKKGRKVFISGCLIDGYGVPRGGWGCNANIKGSFLQIQGDNPVEVFIGLKKLMEVNQLDFTSEDCWLNLNLIWMQKTAEKYHTVNLQELLKIAIPSKNAAMDMTHRAYPPSQWGQHVWNFLGCYLSGDAYDWEDFRAALGLGLGLLNPTTNPSIGDGSAYVSLLSELDKFDRQHNSRLYTRTDARNWLVNYHNSVNVRLGKQKVSHDIAARNYLWI